MARFRIGAIEAVSVLEDVTVSSPITLVAGLPPDALQSTLSWLAPTFYDVKSERLRLSKHGWVLRFPRCNVLIEACGGNHKNRPNFPVIHQLDIPWLERLAAAGCRPEDIHFVMCSHLHCDHAGWFTRLRGDRWVPTFPNARYIVSRRELENWDPRTRPDPVPPLNEGVFEDSVLPCIEAGLLDSVEDGHEICAGLVIHPAIGHTRGHASFHVSDGGETAVFSGDVMHSPLQIAYPDCNSYACEAQHEARITRRRLLEDCADNNRLLAPAHFPEPCSVVRIERRGAGFFFRSALS